MNAFFTNSQRPVVDCLTVAAGILARSEGGRQYVMTPKFVGSWIYLYTMNWKLTMVTGITAYKLEVII